MVSFKIKEWSEKKTWIIWLNFILVLLFLSLYLLLALSKNSELQLDISIPISPQNFYIKLFEYNWLSILIPIVCSFAFTLIFSWSNGLGTRKDISEFSAFGDFLPMNIWKDFTFWILLLWSMIIILPTFLIAFLIRFRQERKSFNAMPEEFAGQI